MKTLHDLFEATLKDVYYAEATILKALPKMIKAVKSTDLKHAFQAHLEETKEHVVRLDQVFKLIDVKPEGKKCPVILGLVEECEELIEEAKDDDVRDAGVLACGQSVEHYEISRYGALRAWAERLQMDEAVALLHETLEEEKDADQKLTELAYSEINEDADDEDGDASAKPSTNTAKKQTKSHAQASARK
jgi:ferritin-like metal-binding protein YciE